MFSIRKNLEHLEVKMAFKRMLKKSVHGRLSVYITLRKKQAGGLFSRFEPVQKTDQGRSEVARVQDMEWVLTKNILCRAVRPLVQLKEVIHADAGRHEKMDRVVARKIYSIHISQMVHGIGEDI